mmetsp:Transcript_182178/g.443336  ORF Transcript_182178/g.443336 Transcript_182178/m.443336 type:complete len:484 (-) Transcript_182178:62-1513(-)
MCRTSVRTLSVAALPHEHAPLANHDIRELHEALPDRLLNVRHAVLLANLLDAGLGLLVRLHGDVGEHVVLDLVVEPAVEEVVDVAAGAEVGRADNRAEIKVIRPRLRLRLEPVDVVPDVVRRDDDERVHVGDHVREDGRQEDAGRELRAADSVAQRGQRGELKQRVRREALRRLDERRHAAGLEDAADDRGDRARELARLERVHEILASLLRLAFLALVHLFHRVGGVVEPLPDEREADDLAVARDHREVARAQRFHVALDEIGVGFFAELVVVEVVVLHVPRLGHHPVHPVRDPARDPLRERATVEAAGHDPALALRGVVPAVADVMPDHRPSRADRGGHHERRDRVHAADRGEDVAEQHRRREEHGEAAVVEAVGPRQDLVEVIDVIIPDLRLELLLNLAHLGGPRGEIEVLAPLAGLVVGHRGLGVVIERDRGADLERAAGSRTRGGGTGGDRAAGEGRLEGARARESDGSRDGHGGHCV